MVGVFRRSLSFPNKINPNTPSSKVRPPKLSRHTRSISLPITRSHPFISLLKHHIALLQSFKYSFSSSSTTAPSCFSSWLCQGLTRLKDLHHCLDHALRLPQTQDALRRHKSNSSATTCCWLDNLVDQFLRFADVYGIFRSSILALKHDHSAAQVAMRKKNDSQMALYVKARKRMAREMIKLVSAVRCIGRPAGPAATVPLEYVADVSYFNVDHELAGALSEAVQVTVTVSLALFNGIAAALSFGGPKQYSTPAISLSTWKIGMLLVRSTKWTYNDQIVDDEKVAVDNNNNNIIIGVESLRNLRKKGDEEVKITLKKMQELEASIAEIEACSETVFRSLINARVSLLNTLTPLI